MTPPPVSRSPELLLEHQPYLIELARRLVGEDSEDLVQGVWVRYLKNPPRDDSGLRGWLKSAARSIVVDEYRSDSARKYREEFTARLEASRQDEVAKERIEALSEVMEGIRALTPSLRTTVSLRYVEGLDNHEIARRQGVTVRAVNARLKRALEELREWHEQRNGDQWAMLLAPLLMIKPARVSLAAKLAIGLVAVVAVVGGFLAWKALGGGTSSRTASATSPTLRTPWLERASRPELSEERTAVAREELELAVELGTLEVALQVEGSGDPVPGATVRIEPVHGGRGEMVSGETDAEGVARFVGLESREYRVLPDRGDALDVFHGRARTRHEHSISVGRKVSGVVRDAAGNPVAGAVVRMTEALGPHRNFALPQSLAGRTLRDVPNLVPLSFEGYEERQDAVQFATLTFEVAVTDEDGTFEIAHVPAGRWLEASAAGHAPSVALPTSDLREKIELRLGTEPAGSLVVRLEGDSRAPLANCWVALGLEADDSNVFAERDPARTQLHRIVRTDDDGVARFEGLGLGTHWIRAFVPGRHAARRTVRVTGGVQEEHWALGETATVVMNGGAAAVGGRIQVEAGDAPVVEFSEDGTAVLEGITTKHFSYRVEWPSGLLSTGRASGMLGGRSTAEVQRPQLDRLVATLFDEEDRPAAGWTIGIAWGGQRVPSFFNVRGKTDARGQIELERVSSPNSEGVSRSWIEVRDPEDRLRYLESVTDLEAIEEIRIGRMNWARVRGSLFGSEDLLHGVVVRATDTVTGEVFEEILNEDGTFEFEALLPATYAIAAEGPRVGALALGFAAGLEESNIRLERAHVGEPGTLRTWTDSELFGLYGRAAVTVLDEDLVPVTEIRYPRSGGTLEVLLQPGTYRLAGRSSFVISRCQEFEIEAGAVTSVAPVFESSCFAYTSTVPCAGRTGPVIFRIEDQTGQLLWLERVFPNREGDYVSSGFCAAEGSPTAEFRAPDGAVARPLRSNWLHGDSGWTGTPGMPFMWAPR